MVELLKKVVRLVELLGLHFFSFGEKIFDVKLRHKSVIIPLLLGQKLVMNRTLKQIDPIDEHPVQLSQRVRDEIQRWRRLQKLVDHRRQPGNGGKREIRPTQRPQQQRTAGVCLRAARVAGAVRGSCRPARRGPP